MSIVKTFVKLDCGMIHSTIWFDMEARNVFITALLMAQPKQFKDSCKAYEIDSVDPVQFIVPPGWYGFVPASGPGIVRMSGLEQAAGLEALKRLSSPDMNSRSSDYDGRRMVRVEGGFLILNYMKYRDRDVTGKERQQRWRERQLLAKASAAEASSVTSADIDGAIQSFRSAWLEKFKIESSWHFDGAFKKHLPNLKKADLPNLVAAFDEHVSALPSTKLFSPEKFCATWRAYLKETNEN